MRAKNKIIKTIPAYLDEKDYDALRKLSFKRHVSIASLIREAVNQFLTRSRR